VINVKTGQDLYQMISRSEISAFTKFYTQFFQKLLLSSYKYVKDVFIAEEIVQDIFLKLWENPDNLLEIKSIQSYLYRAVINASINHTNRQKNIELHHLKIAAQYNEEHLIGMDEENEWVILLHQEIEKLPAQCKKIFKLNRFEHLKYKEIAAMLGLSERTVENHISTALKLLRKAMLTQKDGKESIQKINFLLTFNFF
jgi:RNA polymerase sigma-70 factor (family 1)